jgi:hypothetical protein
MRCSVAPGRYRLRKSIEQSDVNCSRRCEYRYDFDLQQMRKVIFNSELWQTHNRQILLIHYSGRCDIGSINADIMLSLSKDDKDDELKIFQVPYSGLRCLLRWKRDKRDCA